MVHTLRLALPFALLLATSCGRPPALRDPYDETPYAMLVHLEQADRAAPLVAAEHLTRYRSLLRHATPHNPDALPVGFDRRGDDVGLTCAACHTGQINYQGTAVRIDGAPAMIDMIGFFGAVWTSIAATLADEAKLAPYVAAVGGRGAEAERTAAARASLAGTGGGSRATSRPNGRPRRRASGDST